MKSSKPGKSLAVVDIIFFLNTWHPSRIDGPLYSGANKTCIEQLTIVHFKMSIFVLFTHSLRQNQQLAYIYYCVNKSTWTAQPCTKPNCGKITWWFVYLLWDGL